MSGFLTFLLLAAGMFLGYALLTEYSAAQGDSVPKRMWAAVAAAAASVNAAITGWLAGRGR